MWEREGLRHDFHRFLRTKGSKDKEKKIKFRLKGGSPKTNTEYPCPTRPPGQAIWTSHSGGEQGTLKCKKQKMRKVFSLIQK